MINVAVVGIGYRGPNLAGNVALSADGRLHTLCDSRTDRPAELGRHYSRSERLITSGELGEYYIYSQGLNLGIVRQDLPTQQMMSVDSVFQVV